MTKKIKERAKTDMHIVYSNLKERFGEPFITRSYKIADDRNGEVDFHVYIDGGKKIYIDLFHPSSVNSFGVMVGRKIRKFDNNLSWGETYLVNMNITIPTKTKKQLPENIKLVSLLELLNIIKEMKPSEKLAWML